MEIIKVNNGKMSFEMPEGFSLVTKDDPEMGEKLKPTEWAARDKENHVIYDISWQKIPFLANRMSVETIVLNTEPALKMKCENYSRLGELKLTIGGEEAFCLRFSYDKEGIGMISDYILIKHAKEFYAFGYMAREDSFESQRGLFEKMLESVQFA